MYYKLLLCLALFTQAFTVAAQVKSAVKLPAKTTAAASGTYKNGIKLKLKGFKVSEAALYFDDGSSVPADNKVALNQRINLRLIVESGWSESEGMVFPGGTERIRLSTGAVVLDSEDLFKAYDETGVSVTDARYITLKAVITEIKNKRHYIIVTFRVWDKKGTAEITGSYKFFIK